MINGINRYQPESARGTIGTSTTNPTARSVNPARTMLLGRRFPAFLPAIRATANMLSDNGASDKPASMALYSNTIWR